MEMISPLRKHQSLEWTRMLGSYMTVARLLNTKTSLFYKEYGIRKAQPKDSALIKEFIQKRLLEKGGVGVDNLYYDRELFDIYEAYDTKHAFFWVLVSRGAIIGTIGLRKKQDLEASANLTKLYIQKGAECHIHSLLNMALSTAKKMNVHTVEIWTEARDHDIQEALKEAAFRKTTAADGKVHYSFQFDDIA